MLSAQLHSFVLLALPSVEALRSTTSRTGMLMLQVSYFAAQLCIFDIHTLHLVKVSGVYVVGQPRVAKLIRFWFRPPTRVHHITLAIVECQKQCLF